MSDNEFERIQPVPLDEPVAHGPLNKTNPGIPAAREARPVNAATLAIGLLVVIAALVIFVLPRYVAEPVVPPPTATAPAAPASPPAAPSATPSRTATAVSPWENAQRERARAEAKSVLDALLALQYELQSRNVEHWAAEDFAAITALARQGDEAYRGERFEDAGTVWRDATTRLQGLKDGLPARLAQRIEQGEAAIESGEAALATQNFDGALAIEPGNARATAGLERAGRLDRLHALLAEGRRKDAQGDARGALATYREAVALDGQWQPARDALAALEARVASEQSGQHVSAGYAALAAGKVDVAQREFRAAIALGAGAPARDGLQQAEFQASQRRISTLLARITSAERSEQWQQALEASEAALKIDPALAPARDARDRAQARVALDKALDGLARQPEMLLSESARSSADKLLAAGRAVTDPGPRLRAQIKAAEATLAAMRTRVPVTLLSDGKTDVTVFRVGGLGSFAEHRIELLPGDYVAAGTREGYRDVRVKFSVRPGAVPGPVSVQCGQQI